MPRLSSEAQGRLRRRLTDYCRKKRISRNTLRKHLQICPDAFYRIFRAGQHVNTCTLHKVCNTLGWRHDVILTGKGKHSAGGLKGRESWALVYNKATSKRDVLDAAAFYTYKRLRSLGYTVTFKIDALINGRPDSPRVDICLGSLDARFARLVFIDQDGELMLQVYWPDPVKGGLTLIATKPFAEALIARISVSLASNFSQTFKMFKNPESELSDTRTAKYLSSKINCLR